MTLHHCFLFVHNHFFVLCAQKIFLKHFFSFYLWNKGLGRSQWSFLQDELPLILISVLICFSFTEGKIIISVTVVTPPVMEVSEHYLSKPIDYLDR